MTIARRAKSKDLRLLFRSALLGLRRLLPLGWLGALVPQSRAFSSLAPSFPVPCSAVPCSAVPCLSHSAAGIVPVTFAATDAVTTEEKLACVATVVTETGFVPEEINGPNAAAA